MHTFRSASPLPALAQMAKPQSGPSSANDTYRPPRPSLDAWLAAMDEALAPTTQGRVLAFPRRAWAPPSTAADPDALSA